MCSVSIRVATSAHIGCTNRQHQVVIILIKGCLQILLKLVI